MRQRDRGTGRKLNRERVCVREKNRRKGIEK
jgi:hypothetical protein